MCECEVEGQMPKPKRHTTLHSPRERENNHEVVISFDSIITTSIMTSDHESVSVNRNDRATEAVSVFVSSAREEVT